MVLFRLILKKFMKTFKFIFQLAILLLIPLFTIGQNIQIKVFNKTGYNLDSVSFDHFYLGKISKDSTVFISGISEITMHGDVPLLRPFGIIKGKKRPVNLKECGTKSKKKKSGIYAYDILINESENQYQLYWKKHEYK
jgi:hypothetical protein